MTNGMRGGGSKRAAAWAGVLAGIAMAALGPSPARATDFFWNQSTDGLFFRTGLFWTPLNFLNPGPGGANDTVNFDRVVAPASRYTVVDVRGQNDRLLVHNDSLRLDFSGNYSLLSGSFSNPSFVVGAGSGDNGNVILTGAGILQTRESSIGHAAGSNGIVLVDDLEWVGDFALIVGSAGTGSLTIQNNGNVSQANGVIGSDPGSTGTVIVIGAGSIWNNNIGGLDVGSFGSGTLTIFAGGRVTSTQSALGTFSGSTGTATVTGAGSVWNNSGQLSVGNRGTGTLTIANRGLVSNTIGSIGDRTGSTGTVTVTGDGSVWNNSNTLSVGGLGTGTLTIADGGRVSNQSGLIGVSGGSSISGPSAGMVTVTGAGSTWINSGQLSVGNGTLKFENGGRVFNTNGSIGVNAGSTGTVTVTGAGSTWTNSGNLTVGDLGTAALTIANGGEVAVAGNLFVNALSRVHLDSGKLTVSRITTMAPNAIDWRSGMLHVTGATGVKIGAGGPLGATLLLGHNHTLEVDHRLVIENGATLFTASGLKAGSALVLAGGQLFAGGANQQFGAGLVNHGDLIFNNSATVTGAVTNAAGGAITALSGVNVTFNDLVDGPGGFFGPGTVTFSGGFAPGASPAITNFEGNVVFDSTNVLSIELGGLLPGLEHDHLNIAGQLALGGTLDVLLINDFVPTVGDTFDLLDWGSLTGTFSQINLPTLTEGLWDTSALSTTGTLSVVAVPEPGTLVSAGLAALGLVGFARRRR